MPTSSPPSKRMLGTEPFIALFTRKTTFSAVKESLDAFLASEAADMAAARAAILAAAERTEVATVTPVTPKRKTGTPGTPPVPPAARPLAMTPATPPSTPERPLSATRLAQYVTVRGRCERYLRLALFPSEGQAQMQRYGVTPEALSPLLAEAGSVFEHAAVAQLAAEASVTDLRHQSAQACIDPIRGQPVGRALYYQATLTGRIGAVDCEGIADVLDVVRRDDQALDITVIDIKASRRTSVSFCLQVAFYARLLKDALARAAVPVASVRGAIVARGDAGATAALEPFDLAFSTTTSSACSPCRTPMSCGCSTGRLPSLTRISAPNAMAVPTMPCASLTRPSATTCPWSPCSRPQKNAPASAKGSRTCASSPP